MIGVRLKAVDYDRLEAMGKERGKTITEMARGIVEAWINERNGQSGTQGDPAAGTSPPIESLPVPLADSTQPAQPPPTPEQPPPPAPVAAPEEEYAVVPKPLSWGDLKAEERKAIKRQPHWPDLPSGFKDWAPGPRMKWLDEHWDLNA
jgi:hypothetical protein